MRPFSTYPEDRSKMLALCAAVEKSCDDDAAVELADLVRGILEDEASAANPMTQDTKIKAVGHTAGPWRIEQDTTLIWGNCDPDDTSDRGMGYPIAECRITPISYSSWAKGPTEDEGEANARLIAAAPTMAEYIAGRAKSGDEAALKIMEAINANS